jgi:ATPase subunit of ABC transporter with duplicated ATPase domains
VPVAALCNFTVFQGNYDQYVQTRLELEENQMKKYNWEQDQIAHMKASVHINSMA